MASPDGEKGWLFGTVHALPDGVEWRTDVLEDVLVDAGVLVVEIDPGAGDAQAVFQQMSVAADLPPLLARFEPNERSAVESLLSAAEMEERDFARSETWGAALVLANLAWPSEADNGVDRALVAEHDTLLPLETAQAQFAIFDGLPEEEQEDLLLAVATEVRISRSENVLLTWLTGDIAAFEAEAERGIMADPELRAALSTARNRAWIETIASQIRTGAQPLVAVGAAHMLGDDGLPALLEDAGYTVTRIQ